MVARRVPASGRELDSLSVPISSTLVTLMVTAIVAVPSDGSVAVIVIPYVGCRS